MRICLSCRYTVDVLFDLKNISQQIASKINDIIKQEIDYLNFPKIKTAVVSRKTTVTDSARTTIYTGQDSDTDSYKMTRTRSQKNGLNGNTQNKQSNLQVCEKCHSSITDNDIYKLKKTDHIVCKNCSVDTHLDTNEIDKLQNFAETKFCTVFLQDVLRDKTVNKQKLYRIEKDNKGKKTYIVTDKTLAEESHKIVNDVESNTVKHDLKRSLRSMKSENTDNKQSSNKKLKLNVKQVNADSKSAPPTKPTTTVRRSNLRGQKRVTRNASRSSDSDSSVKHHVKASQILTRHKRATGSSLSDADVDNKRDRKRLKSILAGNIVIKSLKKPSSDVNDDSPRRKKIRFTSAPPVMIDVSNKEGIEENPQRKVPGQNLRSASIKKVSEKFDSSDSDDIGFPENDSEIYACEECGVNYENKLVCLLHKLTHYKQPKLELQKVVIKNTIKETSDIREAVDNQSEDQSETIAIRVDDDEEEITVDVTTLDESPVTEDKSHSSTKDRIEDTVDVESITKDPHDDHNLQTKNTVQEPDDQKDAEITVVTTSPSQNKAKTRRGRSRRSFHSQNVRHSYNDTDKSNESIDESVEKANVNAEENQNILPKQTEDVEAEDTQAKEKDVSLRGVENIQTEANEDISHRAEVKSVQAEEKDNVSFRESEDARTEENENTSLTQKENGRTEEEQSTSLVEINNVQAEENQDILLKPTEDPRKEDVEDEQSKDKEQSVKSKIVESISVLETEEGQKESGDVPDEDKAVHTEKESETIDKGDSNESKSSKDLDNSIAGEDEMDSTVVTNEKQIEENSRDEDSSIVNTDGSKDTVKDRSSDSTEKIESSDEDEVQCIQVDDDKSVISVITEKVVVLSKESSTSDDNDVEVVNDDDDNDVVEVDTSNQRKSSDSANAAAEVLQEVLDLASAEVKKRQELVEINIENDSTDIETLENISREVNNGDDVSILKVDNCTAIVSL
ncbi:uncharacterized protein LOC143144207 isoform X2 [Ptiloglossa arizonensis]